MAETDAFRKQGEWKAKGSRQGGKSGGNDLQRKAEHSGAKWIQ